MQIKGCVTMDLSLLICKEGKMNPTKQCISEDKLYRMSMTQRLKIFSVHSQTPLPVMRMYFNIWSDTIWLTIQKVI